MEQEFIDIEKMDLLNKTLDMKNTGCRLAQACCVNGSGESGDFILLYSFIKDGGDFMVHYRFSAARGEPIESISWLYSYAFLYENEMKDLFGVNIININMDFKGLYDTSVKTPFLPAKENNHD